MKHALDLTAIWEKYKGKWVAFDKNYKVLSADKYAKAAYKRAKENGYKQLILFNMPHKDIPYFGSSAFPLSS